MHDSLVACIGHPSDWMVETISEDCREGTG